MTNIFVIKSALNTAKFAKFIVDAFALIGALYLEATENKGYLVQSSL